MPHHKKKGDSACHVSENVQSTDLGGILKQKKLQGRNMTKKIHREENQKSHIL